MFVPEQGSYRASSIQPDHSTYNAFMPGLCALTELYHGNTSVNPWNFQKGQWLTSQNLKILTFYGRYTDLVHKFYTSVSHILKSLFMSGFPVIVGES